MPATYTPSMSTAARPASDDAGFVGHVVLVTGSSSGIGAATARQFAAAGATVVVNSATSVEAGAAVAAELPGATYVQADIADGAACSRLIDEVVAAHGRLDVLVNNAGTTAVIPHGDLEAATPDVWRRIFDVNVIGTWQLTVAAVPHLRASGRGQVVNVSSLAGYPSRRQLHPLRLLEGGGEPHDPPAGQHARSRRPGQRGGPRTRRHPVDRGLDRGPRVRPGPGPDAAGRHARGRGRDDPRPWPVRRYVTGEVVLVDGGLNLR